VRRLNLVCGHEDRELQMVRDTIAVFWTVSTFEELLALLRQQAQRSVRVDLLDLIGHSRSPGFLTLGTWIIDDSPQTAATFGQVLRPHLQQLGIWAVRLLGCATAATGRGCSAIRRVAQVTGCRVFGTKRYISSLDYRAEGFVSDHALVEAGSQSRVAVVSADRVPVLV
jgi:hypothetical protein